jgi:hypothetical protein
MTTKDQVSQSASVPSGTVAVEGSGPRVAAESVREEEIAALLVLAEVAAPRHPFPWRAACDACFVVDRTGLNLTSVTPGMDAIFTWPSAARYAIAAANLAPALAREVLRLREPGTVPAAGIAADATATPADEPPCEIKASDRAAREADRAALRLAEDLAAKWKALSVLQDKLLACYRLGTNPGRTLDRLAAARAALAAKETSHG